MKEGCFIWSQTISISLTFSWKKKREGEGIQEQIFLPVKRKLWSVETPDFPWKKPCYENFGTALACFCLISPTLPVRLQSPSPTFIFCRLRDHKSKGKDLLISHHSSPSLPTVSKVFCTSVNPILPLPWLFQPSRASLMPSTGLEIKTHLRVNQGRKKKKKKQ